ADDVTWDSQNSFGTGVSGPAVIKPAVQPGKSLGEHWHEDQVHENQGCPKMDLPPEFIHHPPGRLGIPMVNARKKAENSSRSDDIVEVGDDVISVVQVQVAEIEAQRQSGQPANPEHRQERQREEHRRVESNRSSPKRKEKT